MLDEGIRFYLDQLKIYFGEIAVFVGVVFLTLFVKHPLIPCTAWCLVLIRQGHKLCVFDGLLKKLGRVMAEILSRWEKTETFKKEIAVNADLTHTSPFSIVGRYAFIKYFALSLVKEERWRTKDMLDKELQFFIGQLRAYYVEIAAFVGTVILTIFVPHPLIPIFAWLALLIRRGYTLNLLQDVSEKYLGRLKSLFGSVSEWEKEKTEAFRKKFEKKPDGSEKSDGDGSEHGS